MTEFEITAPGEGYSGKVGGVAFVDGTATADSDRHPGELSYFRNTDGYTVTGGKAGKKVTSGKAGGASTGEKSDKKD